MTQEEKLEKLNELKIKIEDDKRELDKLKKELLDDMVKNGIKKLSNNSITASIKASSFRVTVRADELKEKYPKIFHELSKRTEIKSSLMITKIKKEK